MLKGSYTAIFISVLLHLLLLIALINSSINRPKVIKKKPPKVTIIKSFLYSAPKKVVSKKVSPQEIITQKTTAEKIIAEIAAPQQTENQKIALGQTVAKILANKAVTTPVIAVAKAPPRQVSNTVKSTTVTTENKVLAVSQGSFSSFERLSRLRQKVAEQQRQQAFTELTQKRSASIMHGEPFPVPHTVVPLTRDQKHKLNTSVSNNTRITKNDNGSCTMVTEQMYGSPIEATRTSFACGESKFDKGFREHMQKVQAKLAIQR
ncbi:MULTISPECIES: hypothetical protein [Colwellia]|uniref:Uncharacterized protein n=1 Tax=Colwellia marinimaniae TaxID=1513592 RepID=A0ABQ0MTP6_9GAMM|nr:MULTISPECIES: hypothetical protein [Colwellia]GAW94991.1 hypothetical protein MTCD1_00590 [Colwellia marinimaniae]